MDIERLETAFTMDTSSIKFGLGATREIGFEMERLGTKRVMVVTDPRMVQMEPVEVVLESLRESGIDFAVFDQVSVEPTDQSFKEAIAFAEAGNFDGFVSVGGGSSIDTAKAANLYSTHPADFLTYVNAPIGLGTPVPGPLMPHVAVPTTSGTGSETTGIAIFDLLEMRAKTGIAHRAIRPTMGIVDPNNTRTLPRMVTACSGFDVLCHGLESYTALPYHLREAPDGPAMRPAYQGSNPISDIWAVRAIDMVAHNILRAVEDPEDDDARSNMLMAATFAGVGFGNAGVHLPHGMSYPVSGMVREFVPEGYPEDHAIIPHGMSVIMNAPAVFRFTASTNAERHLEAARLMGAEVSGAGSDDAGEILSGAIVKLLKEIGVPNGLSAIGYGPDDAPQLAAGAMPQARVIKLSPRAVTEDDLRQLFLDSMTLW
ncbi:MAG: hydroxyacid-oxoacid transhydrogenase [SAR202 cluster bacterium]|jgi:hydroxyacid-oxoacid transhydrogenase|nr:hydroxyacid-oxoacid transhydrogenase [SAR202 cluster bacterium]